jgi:hypothetical protein
MLSIGGGDRGKLLNYFLAHQHRFIIRLQGARHLKYAHRKLSALELSVGCDCAYEGVIIKYENDKERDYPRYETEINYNSR